MKALPFEIRASDQFTQCSRNNKPDNYMYNSGRKVQFPERLCFFNSIELGTKKEKKLLKKKKK